MYGWEQWADGFYVVEHGGALKTGAFRDWGHAREWFRRELDIELPEEQPSESVDA